MNIEVDGKIANVLDKDFKKFKSRLFDLEDSFYEEYKNNNKFQHKADTNQWSWNELNELDLDLPLEKKINFSNYKFF